MIALLAYCALVILIGALCLAYGIYRKFVRTYPEV